MCGNKKLQDFIATNLQGKAAERFRADIAKATASPADAKILKENSKTLITDSENSKISGIVVSIVLGCLILVLVVMAIRKRRAK